MKVSTKKTKRNRVSINAIGSGDDCVQEDLKEHFDLVGYKVVTEEYEEAYAMLGMIVNASKQQEVTLNGYPLIDFLQQVYTQYNGDVNQKPYFKFCRQLPSFPYKERYSKLYLVLQWVIVYGKLESCLCEENLDFAARVISYAGKYLNSASIEAKYKPPVPVQYWASRSKIFWNQKYIPYHSVYLGMEQFIGIVKEYGQNTLRALVRYSLGQIDTDTEELVSDFVNELETRAPHREELGRTLFESLDEETKNKIGWNYEGESASQHVSLIPEFLKRWEDLVGVAVNSVKLDEPLVGAEVQHQDVSEQDNDDDAQIDVDDIAE